MSFAARHSPSAADGARRTVCVIGDTHGHLQLGLCVAARWQRELGLDFDAVFLCGDVGTFTSDEQLDSATRGHGRVNPCELEFLHQWAVDPQPGWLAKIFAPLEEDGLGLCCPVVMIHGNHEGFAHLETLAPQAIPDEVVEVTGLPSVDPGGFIHYLPSGWRCRTRSGLLVAGIGGIERGRRRADYHRMAYIDEDAVAHLLGGSPVDVLLTHQGPSGLQGGHGADALQPLLESGSAHNWFHAHSVLNPEIARVGPGGATLMVPLGDIAFPGKGPTANDPGDNGWAILSSGTPAVRRERPAFWRQYRKTKWRQVDGRGLVCPDLARWAVPGAAAERPRR